MTPRPFYNFSLCVIWHDDRKPFISFHHYHYFTDEMQYDEATRLAKSMLMNSMSIDKAKDSVFPVAYAPERQQQLLHSLTKD